MVTCYSAFRWGLCLINRKQNNAGFGRADVFWGISLGKLNDYFWRLQYLCRIHPEDPVKQ